jgi:hypothetical protein
VVNEVPDMANRITDDSQARVVAGLTGESLTDAIRVALAERLRRTQPDDLAARLREIGEHCAHLPDQRITVLRQFAVAHDHTEIGSDLA